MTLVLVACAVSGLCIYYGLVRPTLRVLGVL